jgi:hypothetical protein
MISRMKTLEAVGVVDEQGELTVRVHTELPPGVVPVELVLPESVKGTEHQAAEDFDWPVFQMGLPPGIVQCSREELYG